MRCNNCGWDNPDINSKCEKCNAPLSDAMMGAKTPHQGIAIKKADDKKPQAGFAAKKFSPQDTAVGLLPDDYFSQSNTDTDMPVDDFALAPGDGFVQDELFLPAANYENMFEESFPAASSYDNMLGGDMFGGDMLEEYIPPSDNQEYPFEQSALEAATVKDMPQMSMPAVAPFESPPEEAIPNVTVYQCAKCGYLLRPGESECAMCGFALSDVQQEPKIEKQAHKGALQVGTIIHGTGTVDRERRKLVGFLISYSNSPNGDFYPVYEGKNFIGRAASCTAYIQGDTSISEKHFSILYRVVDRKIKFRDEQSSNGTYVNDELQDDGELKNLDKIRIGATQLIFMEIPLSLFE